MSSNLYILSSLAIAFIITVASFLMLYDEFPDTHVDRKNHPFFNQEFELDEKKIFLLGSSQVNQLNTTHIVKKVLWQIENHVVYNLAINADDPKKRYQDIEKIISLKPMIIFYGVSFRDFSSSEKEQNQLTSMSLDINPKFSTMQAIRALSSELGLFKETKEKFDNLNSPFQILGVKQTLIQTNDVLEMQTKEHRVSEVFLQIKNNEQLFYFKKIISEFQENNIKVVVFTTPVSRSFINALPDDAKYVFKTILNDTSNQLEVKIYNFTDSYVDLPVWQNPAHVAYNSKAIIFSDDIAEMIIKEINE